ncbi:MAG: 2-dehydropantoate 2-reductase (plasmid) [Arsenophonus sp.]|nr:MAG: 2-dehydropantoate 2-reductase [Arsenophonus sp.]
MKITVLGCGALGQLWLNALFQKKHNVQGWLRDSKSSCNINIFTTDKLHKFQLPANNVKHLTDSKLLVVTLKAWQISDAIRKLLPKIRSDCCILLLNNGLGVQEELPYLNQPLLIGTTTHAANFQNKTVHHIYSGSTNIGPMNIQAKSNNVITKILDNALPQVIWHDNIMISSWLKLAANCVINPLSVIHECCNGKLRQYSNQIEKICREIAIVMNLKGYHTNYNSLQLYVEKIITNTANNISSMLQDIRAQRRTEIDYINGYAIRCAKTYNIYLKENCRLFNIIKNKENFIDSKNESFI